jgi:hypothetical protein
MMTSQQPILFVESVAGKPLAEALLQPYRVEIQDGFTHSGTIVSAEFSLLEHPERPAAALINADTENPRKVGEIRGAAKRILARAYPENWCVAVAVPALDAWALTDPRIREELASYLESRHLYIDRARHIAEVVKKNGFDATNLLQQSPDFRGLVEFLQKHAAPTDGAGKTAAC